MKTIRLSDEVWSAIAERGKFGETEDDVLRRVFRLKPMRSPQPGGDKAGENNRAPKRQNFAMRRQMAIVQSTSAEQNERLIISYDGGTPRHWKLPTDRKDKGAIRAVLIAALQFGEANGPRLDS